MEKRWEVYPKVSEDIREQLLANRNLTNKTQRDNFLHPHLNLLRDPNQIFSQLPKAIKRIKKAISEKELIYIYGDFDVDGITASAILWETLDLLGAKVMPYIPSRHSEGYGLNNEALKFLVNSGAKVVISVDCGITAVEQAGYAKEIGLDLIITDHHQPQEVLPYSFATLHTTTLAGSGVAFKLAGALLEEFGQGESEQFFKNLELATLGTVADMVPLVGENRIIVKNGLLTLANSNRIGLKSLYQEAAIGKNISTYEIGFMISPRLNAMGRMESALDSLRLLLTRDLSRAEKLAQKLGQTNKLRQEATISAVEHAKTEVEKKYLGSKLFVISSEKYEEGVVGLVAGRITEAYHTPSAVISESPKVSKGSARSITGFNITQAIGKSSSLLLAHGGHPMAAGFSIEKDKINLLRDQLTKTAQEEISDEQLVPVLKIDAVFDENQINDDLVKILKEFEPFGIGNPEPVFQLDQVEVLEAKTVGKEGRHLKFTFKTPQGKLWRGIGFGLGSRDLTEGKKDIVFNVVENTWQGHTNIELKVKDIRSVPT